MSKHEKKQVLHFHGESDCYFYATEFEVGDGLCADVTGMAHHETEAKRRRVKPESAHGKCAWCLKPSEGNFTIHDTADLDGPEVPLCDEHGGKATPTCEDIWDVIRIRKLQNGSN